MKFHYNNAKTAKVGESIVCPGCNGRHVKNTYQKVFCSNAKTKKTNNCKDKFWNLVDPQKKCRDTPFFNDVIMPRIANELGFPDVQTMKDHIDETDEMTVTCSNCEWCGMRGEYCRCD